MSVKDQVLAVVLVVIGVTSLKAVNVDGQISCSAGEYQALKSNNVTTCTKCKTCPKGFSPLIPCRFQIKNKRKRRKCVPCKVGFFSDSSDASECWPCRKCNVVVLERCSSRSDTVCGRCKTGFYFSHGCLPCSRCCGDSKDIFVAECSKQGQGLSKLRRCSVHNHFRCPLTSAMSPTSTRTLSVNTTLGPLAIFEDDKTTDVYKESGKKEHMHSQLLLVAMVSVITLLLVIIISVVFVSKRKCSSTQKSKRSRLYRKSCEGVQEITSCDEWAKEDPHNGCYNFQSGICVLYCKTSEADANKILGVKEIHNSNRSSVVIDGKQLTYLSPIVQFNLKDVFTKPVTVLLPHSALLDSSNHDWNIQVLWADLEDGGKVRWRSIVSDLEVEWNQLYFTAGCDLLAYVIVGSPRSSVCVKKRMQFAVFARKALANGMFKATLYLFDDHKMPFQRIQQEEKSRGRLMLDSFYAAFINCYEDNNIAVKMTAISEGWKLLELLPESISVKQCSESYFNVPKWEATFRRVGPCDIQFQCTFEVDAAGQNINVPVRLCLPELLHYGTTPDQ